MRSEIFLVAILSVAGGGNAFGATTLDHAGVMSGALVYGDEGGAGGESVRLASNLSSTFLATDIQQSPLMTVGEGGEGGRGRQWRSRGYRGYYAPPPVRYYGSYGSRYRERCHFEARRTFHPYYGPVTRRVRVCY